MLVARDGVDPAMAHWVARATQGHVGRAKRLAMSEPARTQRREVLATATRVGTIAECLAAAADLVALAEAGDADTGLEGDDDEPTGAGPRRGARAAAAKRARSKETRARRDVLDGALVDLAAWYRDVLSLQLGASDLLTHADHAPTLARCAAADSPEASLRRIEAVLRCREALATNAAPLLAVERLTLALRAG
ncbi:MAG: hypothetical protein LC640_02140 [Frankia sp.]|nr:hypothetical protein [Frankia sp.]